MTKLYNFKNPIIVKLLVFSLILFFYVHPLSAADVNDVVCETYSWNAYIAETNRLTGVNTFGQSWTTGTGVNNLSKIKILVRHDKGASVETSTLGDLSCVVYSSVGSNVVLGSATIARDSIPTNGAVPVSFVFSPPISLRPSTQYYFELSATGGNLAGNDPTSSYADRYVEFHGTDVHSGGALKIDRAEPYSTADMWFDSYYIAGLPDQTLDVNCLTYNWNVSIANSDNGLRTIGQTITAGNGAKALSRIRLLLGLYEDPYVPGLGNPIVTVYSDITATTVLGTSTISKNIMPNCFTEDGPMWVAQMYDFAFNPAIPLTPNHQYYFELSASGGDGYNSYFNEFHGLDAYAGGHIYHDRLDDWANADMHFSTFVVPLTGFTCPELIAQGYLTPLAGDLNKDCYVNVKDFAEFADSWLNCIDPANINCQ
jgi:hypothetical protein